VATTEHPNGIDLAGVRALVTGGSSGLGRAMAEALSRAGASTVVTSRSCERAEEAAGQIGSNAIGLAMDVRDNDSVDSAIERAYLRLGGLDLLVSNAGIGMRTVNPRFLTNPQPFWAVSPEGFRDVIETKITGSFLVARAVVPRMLGASGGRVVMISMNEQTMTRRGFIPYGPSGAGVEALARVMAADLAETSVRVNILLPGGATATGMIPDEASDDVRARLLDPAIMGPPIVWLASKKAAQVHGERIVATDFEEWLVLRTS
jgi:NAD(P)-dependent dehydrogenase (short-subunit alcohol dehydrogenase family)